MGCRVMVEAGGLCPNPHIPARTFDDQVWFLDLSLALGFYIFNNGMPNIFGG